MSTSTKNFGLRVNKKALVTGLSATLLISATHWVLACIYRYLTNSGASSIFFDFDTWSYPFRKDVLFVNFTLLFVGLMLTILATLCSPEKE